MSSPLVLTWLQMPAAQARRTNLLLCAQYLQLAESLYKDGEQRLKKMSAPKARELLSQVRSFPQMKRRVDSLREKEVASDALTEAHAYWIQLKHEWIPKIEQAISDAEQERRLAYARQQAEIMRRELLPRAEQPPEPKNTAPAAKSSIPQPKAVPVSPPTSRIPPKEDEFVQLAEAILAAAVILQNTDEVQRQIETILARRDADFVKATHLKTLLGNLRAQARTAVQEKAEEERRSELSRIYRVQAEMQLTQLREQIQELPESAQENWRQRVDALASFKDRYELPQFDQRLSELTVELQQVIGQEATFRAVEGALLAEGFRPNRMETLTADGIRAFYYQHPKDEDRLVEVARKELRKGKQGLSVEVVRQTPGNSKADKRRDDESQGRLCKIMKSLLEQPAGSGEITVESEVPVGAPMRKIRSKNRGDQVGEPAPIEQHFE